MQRDSSDMESKEQARPSQSRGRTNSKLKMLVRSHAMREEASPPPDPFHVSSVTSPCIKLIPSPNSSPCSSPSTVSNPVVVLSPSMSRSNSPNSTTSLHASSVFVPTPKTIVLHSCDNEDNAKLHVCDCQVEVKDNDCISEQECDTTKDYYLQEANDSNDCDSENSKLSYRTHVDEDSDCMETHNKKNFKSDKDKCDCIISHTCTKCLKDHKKNINNNNITRGSNNGSNNSNTLTVARTARNNLSQQSASQGNLEGSSSNPHCLSRDNSAEQYTDTTGVDLEKFISETLNRNSKDRALMLRIEQELISLAKDKIKSHYKFPPMSSYQRMLVHRCAAYFGMDHNIESSGKCVVVNKTKNTRIPNNLFKEYVKEDIIFVEEPQRSILKRDSNSIEDYCFKSPNRQSNLENRRSKSFEQREEEYEKARRRIFNRDMHQYGSAEEFRWSETPWSSTDSECSSRFQLLHPEKHASRLLKVQSVETTNDILRPYVAKSYSFGGYGGGISMLTRGDSVLSTHSADPRLLTKQDSGASTVSWRLSPSSSGYKSQSQVSESVTPSPTSTPNPPNDTFHQESSNATLIGSESESLDTATNKETTDSHLMWAVTAINEVPKGSIIINPQTGQPVKNADGTIYHYDPSNPPPDIPNVSSPKSSIPLSSPSLQRNSSKDSIKSQKSQQSGSSPTYNKRNNLINSATSPCLSYTPPLPQNYPAQFSSSVDGITNVPFQHPTCDGNYTNVSVQDSSIPVYQQPCIIYASYGAPIPTQLETRMQDTSIQEPAGSYFIADPAQNLPYQSAPPYWVQQPVTVYQNLPPTSPLPVSSRYAVSNQTGPFLAPSYTSACEPLPSPNVQLIPHSSQNVELTPMYSHHPVQILFPVSSGQSNAVVYPSQNTIYPQNPVCPNVAVPIQNAPQTAPYIQNCPSSIYNSSQNANRKFQKQEFLPSCTNINQFSQDQLGYNMAQLNISPEQTYTNRPNSSQSAHFVQNVGSMSRTNQQDDITIRRGPSKNLSDLHTENVLPASHFMTNYCNSKTQNTNYCRLPSPPTQEVAFPFCSNFAPSMVFRQVNNVQGNPSISRTSRSSTPASDITQVERQRFMLPTSSFRGTPCTYQNDHKMLPYRNQSVVSRQQSTWSPNFNNLCEEGAIRSYRNRKPRGNKTSGLPPNGK